jgi:hypothetical protein
VSIIVIEFIIIIISHKKNNKDKGLIKKLFNYSPSAIPFHPLNQIPHHQVAKRMASN